MKWSILQRIINLTVFLVLNENIGAQAFTLKGTIENRDTGYVILRYFRDASKQRQSDTVAIKNGKFQFTGTVAGADFALVQADTIYGIQLFIEPKIINIAFTEENSDKTLISGSKSQREYEALQKYLINERTEMRRISKFYKNIDSLLKNGLIDPKEAEEKRRGVNSMYNPVVRLKSNKELSFIKKHPNSYVSLSLLYYFVGRLSNDSIDIMYSLLSNKIKGSTLDYSFLQYNSKVRKAFAAEYPFDKLKMDDKAPPFTIYNTLKNDSLKADNFMGKVLILEFWGLYCYPCLKLNPFLEDTRRKYGKDKLEIIAINNNQNQEMPELIAYINRNNFTEWSHVFTNDEVKQKSHLIFKGDFSNYSGLGVPRTVLIDKKGRIIYKNYGYTPEEIPILKAMIDKAVKEDIKKNQ